MDGVTTETTNKPLMEFCLMPLILGHIQQVNIQYIVSNVVKLASDLHQSVMNAGFNPALVILGKNFAWT